MSAITMGKYPPRIGPLFNPNRYTLFQAVNPRDKKGQHILIPGIDHVTHLSESVTLNRSLLLGEAKLNHDLIDQNEVSSLKN